MTLGDGIRYNIAKVDPTERTLLRDALIQINHRYFPGTRTDSVPGGVSWWFKQDEIHQATHVHQGPEFLPWHREIVNRLEDMLRQINPQLSLHYWDWTEHPGAIPDANLGGGTTGTLDLFTSYFMGYGGSTDAPIGEPWENAGFYVPGASPDRDSSGNPADPPLEVHRSVVGVPATVDSDNDILAALDYADMRVLMEQTHDDMHGFVRMGPQHLSFRDPFVFLLHSNVDRLFARWQTDPAHPERLDPNTVYGTESNLDVMVVSHVQNVNHNVEPWSTGHSYDQFGTEHFTRPWYAPDNMGVPHTYKHPSVVSPPCYDTNHTATAAVEVRNPGTPPVVNFVSVPTGETATRAAVFRIYGCDNVTIRVKDGFGPTAPFSVLYPLSGELPVAHEPAPFVEGRIWLAYTAGSAGVAVPDGSATFECPETGQEFPFVLKATAINRPTVAVMMALDQSNSMNDSAGTSGNTRIDVLKDAARLFTEVIQKDNGVGLIRFDHNSYPVDDPTYPGLAVTKMTSDDIDAARAAAIGKVNDHQPNAMGNTSVGDGVDRARDVLNALPAADYAQHALIVFTDGLENDPLWISDVAGSIDSQTFAIGLGNEHQVNTQALRDLAHGTGGFLYLTGLLSASIDDYFRPRKFFLQILAGVTNTDIIVDPKGYIAPGTTVRIPFDVTEADIDCTVLLMTDVNVVDLVLETPDGTLIEPAMAPGLGMTFSVGEQTRHYRFTLPVALGEGQREGLWHAILKVDEADFKKTLSRYRRKQDEATQVFATHGPRYSLIAQTYSNLRMRSAVEQSSFEPGADLTFQAELAEYELPVEKRAQANVELTRPGGSIATLPMDEVAPGMFEVTTNGNLSGVYHARIMANGATLRGRPFTREQLGTAAIWRGGDDPYQPPRGTGWDNWCRMIACLLGEKNLKTDLLDGLAERGVDVEAIRDCLKAYCGDTTRMVAR